MAEPRNESQLTARIVAAIRSTYPDAWVLKVHGGGYQTIGVPDLLVCNNGRLVGIEVKFNFPNESVERTLRRVTVPQRKELAALALAGAVSGVALSVEQALDLVAQTTT